MMPRTALVLFTFCLAVWTASAKLDVTTGPASITVKPGENVLLTCILAVDKPPIDMKELMVQWFHSGRQVAEYDKTITIDKPEYSLSMDALKKGNASLLISGTNIGHSGNFRCYVYYNSDFRMKQIKLAVEDPTKTKEEESDTLPELNPSNDQKTMKWVIEMKKAMDNLQETVNLMRTDVQKCAAGNHGKDGGGRSVA